jgi:hypothetical protein
LSQLISAVGKPDYYTRSDHFFVAKYGCSGPDKFATRGTAYLSFDGSVKAVYGFSHDGSIGSLTFSRAHYFLDLIDTCPGLLGRSFNPSRFARVVNRLIKLPKANVIALFSYYLRHRATPNFLEAVAIPERAEDRQDYRVAALLFALFGPMPESDRLFRGVWFQFPYELGLRSPLVIFKGIPVMACEWLYDPAFDDSELLFLKACEAKGVLRTSPLRESCAQAEGWRALKSSRFWRGLDAVSQARTEPLIWERMKKLSGAR